MQWLDDAWTIRRFELKIDEELTMNRLMYACLAAALMMSSTLVPSTSHAEDSAEASKAFMEKRPPVFKGQ